MSEIYDTSIRHRSGAGRAAALILPFACLLMLASCAVDKAALASRIGLEDVDLRSMPDGVYEGSYTITPPFPVVAAGRNASVRVMVAGGRYTDIQVVAPASLRNSPWVRGLLARVRDAQRLSVDAITSGTITSMAVLKAVQQAVGGSAATSR